ncbi:unnamed protein product [Victoria cruziana]
MGNLFSYLIGHDEPKPLLLSGSVSDLEDEESDVAGKIRYIATFDELEGPHVQYDTIIWVLISLLLILTWGVGLLMLLYLPVRRYILRKDLQSRKLYVTAEEVVYKVSRPSFLPFLGSIKIEKHVLLPLVVGVIIEQGCLQSVYGIHTCRIESMAYGKSAPVDELQVQGVTNPCQLQKAIMAGGARSILRFGGYGKPSTGEADSVMVQSGSINEASSLGRSLSPSMKMTASRPYPSLEPLATTRNEHMLNKLEEIEQSVKKIESLLGSS